MRLIVGLGNPGDKYAGHRHNVGFMAADEIAERHQFSPWREKFQGFVCEGTLSSPEGREKAIILKPLTFMNKSGQAVRAAAKFYKIDLEDIFVLYDELDLAPGKLRVKTGGGAAGHNGIRSIDAHLGNGFRRVRIGIGHPGDKSRVGNYVLGNFSKADQDWLQPMLYAISNHAGLLAVNDQHFASAVSQQLAPPREPKKQTAQESSRSPSPSEAKPAKTNADSETKPDQKKPDGPFGALSRLLSSGENKSE